MSFSSDFTTCMSPLPTPGQIGDSTAEVLEVLHKLHDAWEAAGADEEMALAALVALGAATGVDEEVLAALGQAVAQAAAITVAAYIAACVACLVSSGSSSVWDLIKSSATPSWLQGQLTAEAEKQGIENPQAVA